jgi:hypothetical protein
MSDLGMIGQHNHRIDRERMAAHLTKCATQLLRAETIFLSGYRSVRPSFLPERRPVETTRQ